MDIILLSGTLEKQLDICDPELAGTETVIVIRRKPAPKNIFSFISLTVYLQNIRQVPENEIVVAHSIDFYAIDLYFFTFQQKEVMVLHPSHLRTNKFFIHVPLLLKKYPERFLKLFWTKGHYEKSAC